MGGFFSKPELPESQTINATCGPVRGKVFVNNEQIVDGYLGIPYAKSVNRFERAEPAEPWKDTLNCTEYGPRAPSGGRLKKELQKLNKDLEKNVDEKNCLNLNVFVPRWKSENQEFVSNGRPVIVFIHNSDFQYGSGCDYDAKLIAGLLPHKDMIVVTFTYRVGILGFLTTGDGTCKGNFGLWDQTLALQWVQNHIKSFGGNPNNITLLGDGAGAASAELLALSPHSRDLFHKMILLSGSAFSSFAIRTEQAQSDIYTHYAAVRGCSCKDPLKDVSLLEFYQDCELPAVTCFENLKEYHILLNAPNMDGDFFPKPLNVLRKEAPKKSVIIGVSEIEDGALYPRFEIGQRSPEEKLKKAIEWVFDAGDYDDVEKIREQVFTSYRNYGYRPELPKKLTQFTHDYQFNRAALDSAKESMDAGWVVYYYYFFNERSTRFPDFVNKWFRSRSNDKEKLSNDQMLSFFSNFATNGNPNTPDEYTWFKYTLENPSAHLRIDLEGNVKMVTVFPVNRWFILEKYRSQSKDRRAIFDGE